MLKDLKFLHIDAGITSWDTTYTTETSEEFIHHYLQPAVDERSTKFPELKKLPYNKLYLRGAEKRGAVRPPAFLYLWLF